MSNYNFQTLSAKDFEEFSRDILQKHFSVYFESFKQGADGGVDLYHSSSKDGKIIVQAKHWFQTGFSKLKSHLQNKELTKIKKLNPSRYVLTTSVPLSLGNKKELVKILNPFVKSTSDIFGKDDLNNLLDQFPDIERLHHKLWFSSTNVLRSIVNNGMNGRSQFTEEDILHTSARYVNNQNFDAGLKILNDSRFLIVTGEPGVGKTVLAKMLLFELLGDGYQLISITEKISEAEGVWGLEDKQVFYFDDFLGSNYLEILQSKNNDSQLVNFIKRVQADPRKRFILTSRTVVLNQAKQQLQKLNDPILKLSEYEIHVGHYDDWTKAQILYNHVFFSGLGDDFRTAFYEDKNYWKIINHQNFSPRLVEFVTNAANLKGISSKDYWQFALDCFENPAEIWNYQYERQIDDYARFLICSLLSLGYDTKEELLQNVFEARLEYEIRKNGFKRENNIFNLKIRDLLGSFFTCIHSGKERTYHFFNPSIIDFLISYLNKADAERWRILESATYLEQFRTLFSKLTSSNKGLVFTAPEDKKKLFELFVSKERELKIIKNGSREAHLIDAYQTLFDAETISERCLELLKRLKVHEISSIQLYSWMSLLEYLSYDEWWREAVIPRWTEIADSLFQKVSEKDELENILSLFKQYDQDFSEYVQNGRSGEIVQISLEDYWDNEVDAIRWGNNEIKNCRTQDEVEDYLDRAYSEGAKFNAQFDISKVKSLEKLFSIDTEELAASNAEAAEAEDHLRGYGSSGGFSDSGSSAERVDQLFSGLE